MLTSLINTFNPSTAPSALLVIGRSGATINVLHLVPSNGSIERFSLTTPPSMTTFRHGGAKEQTREQIGVVTLYVGDGETANSFLDDAETRIRKLWDDSPGLNPAQLQTGSVEVTRLVQDVLKPAALDAIHGREGARSLYECDADVPCFCGAHHTLEGRGDPG